MYDIQVFKLVYNRIKLFDTKQIAPYKLRCRVISVTMTNLWSFLSTVVV